MSTAINDSVIRDVVNEVLKRLQAGPGGNGSAPVAAAPVSASRTYGRPVTGRQHLRRRPGVHK